MSTRTHQAIVITIGTLIGLATVLDLAWQHHQIVTP